MSTGNPEPLERSELLGQLRIDRAGPPRRSRLRPLAWAGLGLVVLAAGLWLVLGRFGGPSVQTAVARPASQATGEAASVLDASGYVTARRQATVSAKITGKIVAVLIEEGQVVKEGEVLARLDDTEARAQLGLAQAQLTAARSQLAEIRAMLAQAERDFVRHQELARRELISEQSLDAALAQRDMLRARLRAADEQTHVAQESVRVAQVQLDNTVIRAPFGGVVVAKAAQPGETISPMSAGGFTRTGIGTIVDMDSLEIQVDVNEAFIGRVVPDQPVEATLNAYPDWKIPASVIAIIPSADRSKATVRVRIAIRAKDARIVPDMGVRVGFLGGGNPRQPATALGGVLVPAEAVRGDGAAGVVFVYASGKVERRSVTLGRTVGASRHVLTGVADGERVVISPPESLRDGDPVRLAEKT